ncbi:CRISPR-associated protein Csx3 [Synechococcus bigranulatus str. 'Rupite']|uniref:CRISPR-associated protein Csx3 n=1 Tax=Thermostichus vulcanus str. 'Rupite' TaxID=2813851 RepID=A0ABT0C9G0_THEVL|nr:CRISPR-associated ring nuclease Crn3/Csx3 [Thermostichus vulcanus]MCJ2542417.1 CRISPR-associated protein Csx3 [Thermostichus vulcanus str. 'Rupite']
MSPIRLHLRFEHLDHSDRGELHFPCNVSGTLLEGGLSFQVIEIELTRPDRLMFPVDLQTLKLPDHLNPRLGVVLTGRAPIWLYGWLVHECHFTRWVACYDPRLGAVVVSSHSPEVRVGEIIPWMEGKWKPQQLAALDRDPRDSKPTEEGIPAPPSGLAAAVMVAGPPNSGKSRLAHALFHALLPEYPGIYLQRAHWDGEGNWTLDLPPEQAKALKQRHRGRLTPEFFGFHAQAILNLRRQKSLVIVDVGGQVDPHKQPLLEACSHYVLVSRDPEAIPPWREFCQDRGNLRGLAILHTSPQGPLPVGHQPVRFSGTEFPLQLHWIPGTALPEELVQAVRRLIPRMN